MTRVQHDARVATLRNCGVMDLTVNREFDRWTTALRRNSGATVAAICFFDGSRRLIKSIATVEGSAELVTELAPDDSLETYVVGLANSSAPTAGTSLYADSPITIVGQIVGRVGMAVHGRDHWAVDDLQSLEDITVAVSGVVALRLANREAERVDRLVASHNMVQDLIAQGAPLREVLVGALESMERHDPSIKACVLMLDPVSNTLHSGVGPSLPPEYLAAVDGVVIGPSIGTCGSAAWSGQLTITADIAADPKWAPIRELAKTAGLGHCWSMPIKATGGEVMGTLAFYGDTPREPLPEHLAQLRDWARVAGIAIERNRAMDRLTHDARHDGLTGLPNRTAIFEALDEAIQRVNPEAIAAVLFIDLDGLKTLNDTLGHDRADEMIREMGGRLSSGVRAKDFVGRFGGDEFVVIAEGITDPDEAGQLGLRLLEAISRPLPGVDSTFLTASIGIALVRSNAVDAREAIRDSDSAMYDAKRAGRDRCVFFEVGQQARTGRRLLLARELRGAEMRGEMRLEFQPVFALPALDIVAVEAQLRWRNPTFGEVPPAEFLPIAEDTDAIVPIGAWVLRESCEKMARLSELGQPLEIDVKVSARQVSNPDFALWIRQTLAHAEFPANRLGLEITESALVRPDAVTTRNLRELASLGVRIVLDDFGTGYSSLSWLKEHPFSALKIDRSFVSGLPGNGDDRAIVAAVIGMAKALGCVVTAVGVDTEQQLAALQTLDCERVQGMLLASPEPVEELTARLHDRSSASSARTPAAA